MDRSKSEMNLSQLTDDERQSILRVLKRDQALRTMEEKRLMYLRSELHMLKKRGALKPGLDSGSRCARCLTPLGLLLNSGADCFICLKKVCHSCRQNNEISQNKGNTKQWACLVCSKQMELKAVSGDWMEVHKSSKKDKNFKSYELTKVLTHVLPTKPNEKPYASIPSQPHFSPTMSIRSAPATCSKIDPPRKVQFSPGSPQSLTDFKKFPGNSNIPSPPVLKKRPLLLRNPALDHTIIDTEGSVLSKLAKNHPEMKIIDDKERLPVTGVYYNKCRSRRDSSSSMSTCSLSSTSLQGPSPRNERKNVQRSSLEFDSSKTSVLVNDIVKEKPSNPIEIVQLRVSQNIGQSTNDRSISEPCYKINVPNEDEIRTLKSYSLGSYDEAHFPQALHSRNNNLISGSFENFSDTTSNSGPPSINQSRPSSISPATFRRVLVSSYNDSSSSHSESELESTPKHSAQFSKVCLKKNSPPESTYGKSFL